MKKEAIIEEISEGEKEEGEIEIETNKNIQEDTINEELLQAK